MADYMRGIDVGIDNNIPHHEIVRKIYLCYPTHVFHSNEELQYEIFNQISSKFCIPFSSIHVVGSAKIGQSIYKSSMFSPGDSDLDIAIISNELFIRYSEIVFYKTKGFQDIRDFPQDRENNRSKFAQYKNCISKGIFRPDLMPYCPEKEDWFSFFNKLSQNYRCLFKSINAGIYQSQCFFEIKQSDIIEKYREGVI
ncbi:hypothetical protein C5472_05415 [Photorhabdus sp. RW14-46]|nr:hypothetical protein [Photorhabdus sp. RW14-46]